MKKRIISRDQAKADVRAIDKENTLSVVRGIDRYAATNEGDVKRLQGVEPPEYRLRVGSYRVRFYDFGDSIAVLAVKHRREAYR